jgi:glycogen synthase kinase 3 beta
MKDLGSHQNIVTLQHAFYTNGDKPEELFLNLVMDFVSDTVYKILKSHGKNKMEIPLLLVKCYSYQIARGLAYMHSCGICHRDIKPQNLLVCPRTHVLKLCDFGSAKKLAPNEPNVSYICSRYYRAPELIFGAVDYTFVVDNWSMGCVLGELIQGLPLFPGENGVDQLVQIIKVLGTPTTDDMIAMNPNYTEFKFPMIKANSWDKAISRLAISTTDGAVELLSGILQYDPKRRWSSAQILSSSFFDDLRNPDLKIGNAELKFFDFKNIELEYLSRLCGGDKFSRIDMSQSSTAVSSPCTPPYVKTES